VTKALIIYAHPAHQRSRANRVLLDRIADLEQVTVHDLYQCYPDFFIDVEAEQQRLREHDLIVIQHPVYWYNMPALLREWQDLVLEYGFAYGKQQRQLAGKGLWVVMTAGAPERTYGPDAVNERPLRDYFLHYDRMANVCELQQFDNFELYYSRHSDDAELFSAADVYRQQLLKHLKELSHG
tara:strand:+ start:220 stop:765 length:546 start_codon:yes stop_codon:yes gene_type:complete